MAGETRHIDLEIGGMGCDGCVATVREALGKVPGVASVTVDLAGASAAVDGTATLDPQALVAAVEDAGYEARPR